MAKMRGIKPETFTDDKILQLTPLARWLFVGMWTIACDNGHIEDNLVQLKVRLLPMDSCDVSALVEELTSTGQVEQHSGYLKIAKLTEHQKIDKRYLRLCEWCGHDGGTVFTEDDRPSRPSRAHRGHDVPTVGAHRGHVVEGEGEGEGEGESSRERDSEPDHFATFYDLYPKKVGKGQAAKAHKAALKKTSPDTILAGLEAQLPALAKSERQFIPNPATWLNGERWDDDLGVDEPDTALAHTPSVEELQRRRGF